MSAEQIEKLRQLRDSERVDVPDISIIEHASADNVILGIQFDFGSTNLKAVLTDDRGQTVGAYSISVSDCFENHGLVNTQRYSQIYIHLLETVFKENCQFEKLQYISYMGFYPSLQINNTQNETLQQYGFSYATMLGLQAARELSTRENFYPATRQIPPMPSGTPEVLEVLLKSTVSETVSEIDGSLSELTFDELLQYLAYLLQAEDIASLQLDGIPHAITSLLATDNLSISSPELQYMGIVNANGESMLSDDITTTHPTIAESNTLLGLISPEALNLIAPKINFVNKVQIISGAIDGPAIHWITDIRLSGGTTAVASKRANQQPSLDKKDSIWALKYAKDDWRFGLAANAMGGAYTNLIWNEAWKTMIQPKQAGAYSEFFNQFNRTGKDGVENRPAFFANVCRATQNALEQNELQESLPTVGVLISSPGRDGSGPKELGIYGEHNNGFPEDPRLLVYLIAEEGVFAARRAIEMLERVSGETMDNIITLGIYADSPLVRELLLTFMNKKTFNEVMFDGETISQPNMLGLTVASLTTLGRGDLVDELLNKVSYQALELNVSLNIDQHVLEKRYELYCKQFEI